MQMAFTPKELRAAEQPWTQGWIQFETGEYILADEVFNKGTRDAVLDLMQKQVRTRYLKPNQRLSCLPCVTACAPAQGRNKACGFIGPFDAVMREGVNPRMADGINDLIKQAAKRGIAMGRVVGSGSMEDPQDIEDAMVRVSLYFPGPATGTFHMFFVPIVFQYFLGPLSCFLAPSDDASTITTG